MKIAIGADSFAYELKKAVGEHLKTKNIKFAKSFERQTEFLVNAEKSVSSID